jgi:hypothetical protein
MNNLLLWGVVIGLVAVFVMLALVLVELKGGGRKNQKGGKKTVDELNKAYSDIAEEDINHLFNKQFREELRNRGRLRFETIIKENAMFLKQDLDLTISQLNDHLKSEISSHLQEEFASYAKAMNDAQELALTSLRKTASDVETQRVALGQTLQKEVAEREAQILKVYEDNMAQIIEYYVQGALGDQFDLRSQLPYIIEQMDANKEAIIKDMKL